MGDYHTTYKEKEGTTTEWDDIQVCKHCKAIRLDSSSPAYTALQGSTRVGRYTHVIDHALEAVAHTTQIKLGNKAPVDKGKAAKPWASSTDGAQRDTAWLEDRTADDLEELADEFDDDRGLEAFRWAARRHVVAELHSLHPYKASWGLHCSREPPARGCLRSRQKRMAELKAAKQQQRFGSVRDIGRADFVREVSNAGADVHVVVHLHQDG
jgi:hypothetical protein